METNFQGQFIITFLLSSVIFYQELSAGAIPIASEGSSIRADFTGESQCKELEKRTDIFGVGTSNPKLQIHRNFGSLPSPRTGHCGIDKDNSRIVGGYDSAKHQFPWIVRLGFKNENSQNTDFKCAGSLINDRYILTAAHCFFEDSQRLTLNVVRLGAHNDTSDCSWGSGVHGCFEGSLTDIHIQDQSLVTMHPEYNRKNFYNDIALIRLPESVNFSKWIQPICLPLDEVDNLLPYNDVRIKVAGWGRTDPSYTWGSESLKHVELPLYPKSCCAATLRKASVNIFPVSEKDQFCLGDGINGGDSCKGDSGGPAMFQSKDSTYFLMGIVSYGSPKCDSAGVYTKVESYVEWILENIY